MMKGFVLMTVLLLLENHSFKADGGGTITTVSVLDAAESTEDSGTDDNDTEVEDHPKKKLRSRHRHRTTTVTPTLLGVGDNFEDVHHFVDDDDDWRYKPDLTVVRGHGYPNLSEEEILLQEKNKRQENLQRSIMIMNIIGGAIFFFVICGLAVSFRTMCKKKPSPTCVPVATVPAFPRESRPEQLNLLLPPPNLFTSQYVFQPNLNSSQQNLFAGRQDPSGPQQIPYQPESNPYYPQPNRYPPQPFNYPEEGTTYSPPDNMNMFPRT